MDPIQLMLLSVLLYGLGAIAALVFNKSSQAARYISAISGMAAAVPGFVAAIFVISGVAVTFVLPGVTPFGHFVLQIDGLSALLVAIISLVSFATSLYSIPYLTEFADRGVGVMGFFNNVFTAAMLMLVIVANAFFFLIFWELMTLASYFLVIFNLEDKESVNAGYIYFLVTHIGTAFLMVAFFILYQNAGSFDFSAFKQSILTPGTRNLVFILAFLGFGTKAGIVPMHIWLPRAHPAAPSHVSALLSGVTIKTAIYGILRLCVVILAAPAWWWGLLVMAAGIVSAVLGIFYALPERDIKRLLAYSSVENIGIILVGAGAGITGMAMNLPGLAIIGFLAALYHTINHALFKSLLFMGAGSIDHQLHTHNLDKMGGLGRFMPWTALIFLIGALSISAIPPLNGFISEWFNYQALFIASQTDLVGIRIFTPLFAILLALAGAITVMCFVKAYGTAFTGPARYPESQTVHESPLLMLLGKGILAAGCIFLGLGAPLVVPVLSKVAAGVANISQAQLVNGALLFTGQNNQIVLSPPWIAILLLGLLALSVVVIVLYGGFRAGTKVSKEPWACGYNYSPIMSITAGNFMLPARAAFRPLYTLRTLVQKPLDSISSSTSQVVRSLTSAEPVLEKVVSQPTNKLVEFLANLFRELQMGDIRMYCLYIVLTLAVLLIIVFI